MHIITDQLSGRNGSERKFIADGGDKTLAKPIQLTWGQPIPGEEETTRERVYEASKLLVDAGLSVIPIDAVEGSKGPDNARLPRPLDSNNNRPRPSWAMFQVFRPTPDDLRGWFESPGPYGLAVICGTVSGGSGGFGLEVIDFDQAEIAEPWKECVERLAPGLLARLVQVQTPRPGLHVYYRCSQIAGNQKLAMGPSVGDDGKPVTKTLIETKGEGGYCLIPPSPARCHPTSRLYRYAAGSPSLTQVPTITPAERKILLDAAKELNQVKIVKPAKQSVMACTQSASSDRVGDDFNARATWEEVLIPHGWTRRQHGGDEGHWCRPGKPDGTSATTNYQGADLLHIFSSNADPLVHDENYSKFAAYAFLNHGGDFSAAARELSKLGYGKASLKSGRR